MDWKSQKVLVTGGASFIGSHLVDALLEREVKSLLVIDDLSSGRYENIAEHVAEKRIEFRKGDLREQNILRVALKQQRTDHVFHLAADHGGRGYVDLHNAQCANNLFLDGLVFDEAARAGVDKVTYASSGCVYPNHLQTDVKQELYLTEDLVGPPYLHTQDADNLYGWAKLMAEMTLHAYVEGSILPSAAACRYFTVYGPRGKVDHAVIAMIARAFIKQEPFEVWGDGSQIRNWTHVKDIVEGTIKAAEFEEPFIAVNLGTQERVQVVEAVVQAIAFASEKHEEDYHPELKFLTDMPTGPLNRVCDNKLAKEKLEWEPTVMFADGLVETAKWFYSTQKVDVVEEKMKSLTER